MENHYNVAIKLDRESEERLKKIREQIAQQNLSDCMKKHFNDPLQIEEYDSSPEGLMKRFRHLLYRVEYLAMTAQDNLEKNSDLVKLRNQLIDFVSSLFWWKNGESSMENAPRDGTEVLVYTDRDTFDLVTWNRNQWIDNYEKPLRTTPIKWWSLPEKIKKLHLCENGSVQCYEQEDGSLWLMIRENVRNWQPHGYVKFCPICGFKGK